MSARAKEAMGPPVSAAKNTSPKVAPRAAMVGAVAVFLPLQTATSIRSWITALRVNTGLKRARTGAAPTATAKSADDIVLRMPVGTVITNADTGEVIADLAEHEQKVVLAKGGAGGLGNLHFKSSTNRTPRQFTPGEPGAEFALRLELKVLADVGLLGMPNAGKSSLIWWCFARAAQSGRLPLHRPCTRTWAWCALIRIWSFVMADIPGLIEGAAEGAGLGHRFLKHLARTRLLLHVVDIAPLDENVDPVHEAKAIIKELKKKYDETLYRKPRWLVLNKADLLNAQDQDKICKKLVQNLRWKRQKLPCFGSDRGRVPRADVCDHGISGAGVASCG